MTMLQHTAFYPFTIFWPTDKAVSSLPQEQKNWLYSEDHLDKLQAYLKFHIVRDQRVSDPFKYIMYTNWALIGSLKVYVTGVLI